MRYYDIKITGAKGSSPTRRYTSYVNGVTIPAALDVELDVQVIPYATPAGDSFIRIWGVRLADISQASDLNNAKIQVFAGFQKGLPLANPAQAGLIAQGYIFYAFGNWIGTSQTLDMIIKAGSSPTTNDAVTGAPVRNIVLNWKANTTLAAALKTTFAAAYPGYEQDVKISDKLIRPNDEAGYFYDLTQLSQYVNQASRVIIGGSTYPGVSILLQQNKVVAYDDTALQNKTAKVISYKDLIGQPTWIGPAAISIKCPMRADLQVGDLIQMPKTLVTNSAAASPQVNKKATFQGDFQIRYARHVGMFRQPTSESWATVYEAVATKQVAA